MKTLLCCAACAAIALTTPTAQAWGFAERDRQEARVEREQDLYEQGTDAIDDHDWRTAARSFERVAAMKMSRAEAALYWLAFARNRMGMRAEALSALLQLKTAYPKSKWNNEAEKLDLEIRQSAGQKIEPERVTDEELKLIALNGLMQTDPERAMPILEEMLQSNKSPKLKEKALFILSQSSSPRAYEILSRVAKNGSEVDLQRRALRYLGMMGGERNRKLLADVYASTADVEIKKSVLKAYMLAGDRARLLMLARSEPDAELRSEAVSQLGLIGARNELSELYTTETSTEVRKKIIQAMFLGGASEKLYDIARNEPNLDLKLTAIRNLGLLGGEKTGPFLVSLYDSDSRGDVRAAVINALFIQGNAKALVDLARRETNPELKKNIISKLSLMRSKDASDYLMEYLKN